MNQAIRPRVLVSVIAVALSCHAVSAQTVPSDRADPRGSQHGVGLPLEEFPTPPVLAISPSGGFSSIGLEGGPFLPDSIHYTLKNTGGSPLNWTARATQPWVELSNTDGMLAKNEVESVSVSITSYANGLTAGEYADTVIFENTTNHRGDDTRAVALLVRSASAMVLIPAGSFQMGDNLGDGPSSETPVHTVGLSSYHVDADEVTNQQYVDGLNWANSQGNLITVVAGEVRPYGGQAGYSYCDLTTKSTYSQISWGGAHFFARGGKENYPVVMVSWYGAAAYANWRSAMQGRPLCYDVSTWSCDFGATGYRLPTEAEWENAARGGADGKRFPWTDSNTIQHARANYKSTTDVLYDTSPTRGYHPTFNTGVRPFTSPVGYFASNGYGLYDMAGNVYEWCNDWYSGTYYASSPGSNPTGPETGSWRVYRGGCWDSPARNCRCAFRYNGAMNFRGNALGFRLVLP